MSIEAPNAKQAWRFNANSLGIGQLNLDTVKAWRLRLQAFS